MRSAFLEKIVEKNIPVHFMCELTYKCNQNCAQCYQRTSPSEDLGLEQWKYIINQLRDANVLSLTITGGEPMLHGDFWEICEYARDSGFALAFMTNGTLIGEREAERLSGFHTWEVRLSLYGATAETHDRMSGAPGSFDKVMDACKYLKKNGLDVQFITPLTKINFHELESIYAIMKRNGMKPFISPLIFPNRKGERLSELRLEDDDLRRTFEFLGENDCLLLDERTSPESRDPRKPLCRTGKTSGVITPSGDVMPCVVLPMKAGNLFETTLPDIWRNSTVLNHLRKMTRNDIESCRVCEVEDKCIMCMGMGYMETGVYPKISDEVCRMANTLQGVC